MSFKGHTSRQVCQSGHAGAEQCKSYAPLSTILSVEKPLTKGLPKSNQLILALNGHGRTAEDGRMRAKEGIRVLELDASFFERLIDIGADFEGEGEVI